MNLMELLTPFYAENSTMVELQGVVQEEANKIITGFNNTIDECFVSTSSSLIKRYEKLHGIKSDITKSEDTRRSKIKSKMAGTGTFTEKMLMNTTNAFPGGSCEVIEDNPNCKFTIKFNDYNRVPDEASINEIYAITNELKPAHLEFNHTFTYNWWGMDDAGTWNDGGTWDDLRNYTEV